jgi:hypothetical protein
VSKEGVGVFTKVGSVARIAGNKGVGRTGVGIREPYVVSAAFDGSRAAVFIFDADVDGLEGGDGRRERKGRDEESA